MLCCGDLLGRVVLRIRDELCRMVEVENGVLSWLCGLRCLRCHLARFAGSDPILSLLVSSEAFPESYASDVEGSDGDGGMKSLIEQSDGDSILPASP